MNHDERLALLHATLNLATTLDRTPQNFDRIVDLLEETCLRTPTAATWQHYLEVAGSDDPYRKLAEAMLTEIGLDATVGDMRTEFDKTTQRELEAA